MKTRLLAPFVALLTLAGIAHAGVTFEYIGIGSGLSISADGTVIAGNTWGTYETFRWTEQTGIVPLGMSSVEVLGRGAGTPDISADGTRISATILGADSTYITQGLWTEGQGWQETMPPVPADGGLIDLSYGSGWGLSDDGETLVGFYWRPGASDGSAHASKWSPGGPVVNLGSNGGSSRANDASADGSVIVGWAERFDGVWQPTVWTAAGREILSDTAGFCEAHAVNEAGTKILGSTYDDRTMHFFGAVWDWDGANWVETNIGQLPGTSASQGYVNGNDVTADGNLIVGYNQFFWGNATGFLWTEETGIVDVEDFLADNGIVINPFEFDITGLTAVSDDGSVIVGVGTELTPPYPTKTFLIRIDDSTDAPVVAGVGSAGGLRAFPNPTSGATTLSLELPRAAEGTIDIYDTTGRRVRRIAEGSLAAGQQDFAWDGRDSGGSKVAAGVYWVRLEAGEMRQARKLVIVR